MDGKIPVMPSLQQCDLWMSSMQLSPSASISHLGDSRWVKLHNQYTESVFPFSIYQFSSPSLAELLTLRNPCRGCTTALGSVLLDPSYKTNTINSMHLYRISMCIFLHIHVSMWINIYTYMHTHTLYLMFIIQMYNIS